MPVPVPDELAVIEAFVNTVDFEDGDEALSIPAELAEWLAERGRAERGETFPHDALAAAIAVREALRALLLANNGGELAPTAPATLTAAADRAGLAVAIDEHGQARVEPRAAGIG